MKSVVTILNPLTWVLLIIQAVSLSTRVTSRSEEPKPLDLHSDS